MRPTTSTQAPWRKPPTRQLKLAGLASAALVAAACSTQTPRTNAAPATTSGSDTSHSLAPSPSSSSANVIAPETTHITIQTPTPESSHANVAPAPTTEAPTTSPEVVNDPAKAEAGVVMNQMGEALVAMVKSNYGDGDPTLSMNYCISTDDLNDITSCNTNGQQNILAVNKTMPNMGDLLHHTYSDVVAGPLMKGSANPDATAVLEYRNVTATPQWAIADYPPKHDTAAENSKFQLVYGKFREISPTGEITKQLGWRLNIGTPLTGGTEIPASSK